MLLSGLTFVLSAVLDNLTATIVMIQLLRVLIADRELRHVAGALITIAANAGGAWSPVGDVTTTMLWIENKISVGGIVSRTLVPSLVCYLIPVAGITLAWFRDDRRGVEPLDVAAYTSCGT